MIRELDCATVLLLGPGDELDRVVLRELADNGAWTLATRQSASTVDLTQRSPSAKHWVMTEDRVTNDSVTRMHTFLAAQNRPATTVVLHIDVIPALTSPRPVRWWRLRSEAKQMTLSASQVVDATEPSSDRTLLLVYQTRASSERNLASRWLQRTMSSIIKRADMNARVNSILIGPGDADAGVAAMIALLCSPAARRINGALIPMDDGALARDLAEYDF